MLTIPTSATTAIVVPLSPAAEAALSFVGHALLLVGLYCLWEMLMATLARRRPTLSRWAWLAATGVVLVTATISGHEGYGPATFNQGEIATSWGYVVKDLCIQVFGLSAIVLAGLRLVDARRDQRQGRAALGWWVTGACAAASVGLLLAWLASLSPSVWQAPVAADLIIAGIAVIGLGTLLVAAIRRYADRRAH